MIDVVLSIAAFGSSAIAGIFGLGGGMILICIVPIFLPADAIIPVHGASQLASNASRALFSVHTILWRLAIPFICGSALGLAAAWLLLRSITLNWLPLAIGMYILATLWLPQFKAALARINNAWLIGAVQTGLGTMVGATGPLTTTVMLKLTQNKDAIVATNALFMSISHAAKITLFVIIGFNYSHYWQTIAGMIVGAIFGSFVGTRARAHIDSEHFLVVLRFALTGLALKMIAECLLIYIE